MRLFLLTLSFVTLSGCLHGGAPVVPDSDGGAAPELDSSSLVDLTVAEAGVVTVATFNVRRYFDMICHSGQCGGADDFELQLSPEAFEARTQQVAAAIDALASLAYRVLFRDNVGGEKSMTLSMKGTSFIDYSMPSEPGTWMPASWGESGARLALPLVVTFTDDRVQETGLLQRETGLGDGPAHRGNHQGNHQPRD